MIDQFFKAFIYYSVCSIAIVMLISFISLVVGGQFAGELFVIISGIVLIEVLNLSLYGVVCICIIINILLFLLKYYLRSMSYGGKWRDESGHYILNIKETDEEITVETNFLLDFDVELDKRHIKLTTSTESCIIKKCTSKTLELLLNSNTIIMHRVTSSKNQKRSENIVTANQQALISLTLGAFLGLIQTLMQVETSNLVFLENLISNMINYSIYGFGYIFSLNYFVLLIEFAYNISDSVISVSSSGNLLLAIFIAIILIFVFWGLAFIPGIYIGIKAVLDEIL